MKKIKQFFRLLRINHILAKNGLDDVILNIDLFSSLRFIRYFNPWNWFRREHQNPGVALRNALVSLGPIFIKFGQALSTRPDIFPEEIITELSKLQDKVPPFSSNIALAIIEKTYGSKASEVFASFDEIPLASASIAQVHAATLKSGEDVVVKLLRPQAREIIEQDIAILKVIAVLIEKYIKGARRFKPKKIVVEFEQSLLDELDLEREAGNASQLRRLFDSSPLLYVPKVYWDYVRENILVVERIYGIPVSDIDMLKANKIDMKKLAERGVEIFFTQVFRDCFFHADMHPGNIFVSFNNPQEPQYICVDFGIIGTIDDNDKQYLAENFIAFFNRDYRRVAQLHIDSGWVSRSTRVTEFEGAIRTVCEPIFEKRLEDISLALLVLKLFQVARRFQMEVQPQLVLLQKTLLAIEGLGKQIYPQLDLWSTAKPYLETWIKKQLGPKAFLNNLKNNIPFIIEHLPNMPRLINDVLTITKEQQLRLIDKSEMVEPRDINGNRRLLRGFGAGLITTITAANGLQYFNIIGNHQLQIISLLTAGLGGLLILLSFTNKRS